MTDDIIRRVCKAIADSPEKIPTLTELGAIAGMSPHHLQRVFKRATGLSPHKYGQSLRLDRFRGELQNGESVSSALYGAGFGSPSRIYEDAGSRLGMTPASYAKGGAGARIAFALGKSTLGRIVVAATEKGVCFVGLGDSDDFLENELRDEFPAAEIKRDDGALAARLKAVLDYLVGKTARIDLPLDIRATAFQWQVWQTLRAIPLGETLTYGEIASRLGRKGAARAVGRACATNPVSLIVPCHRALGADAKPTGYRWGVERKKKLLATEEKRKRQIV
ncbi:MAG: methylated-DNA--[protein]-cysteine S-methyltransferase [Alphaproteobacteria bacterium]|nr:methylated-DNA--[protein]-cysteine S-methyltransferase [Alphaproteobacteria bacterium]